MHVFTSGVSLVGGILDVVVVFAGVVGDHDSELSMMASCVLLLHNCVQALSRAAKHVIQLSRYRFVTKLHEGSFGRGPELCIQVELHCFLSTFPQLLSVQFSAGSFTNWQT